MTDYEREVLKAIEKGEGRFGWYKIEQSLSNTFIGQRGRLPDVLASLVTRGSVSVTRADAHDVYSITSSGRHELRGLSPL